jgi:hypothetical protein
MSNNTITCVPVGLAILGGGLTILLVPLLTRPQALPQPVLVTSVVMVEPPPGIAPPDVPQPGQPGGGDPPSTNPQAAALAPPGTVPVAVFPPFIKPRTFPSMCVIFSELTASEQRHNSYGRKKQGLLRYNQPQKQDYRQVLHYYIFNLRLIKIED